MRSTHFAIEQADNGTSWRIVVVTETFHYEGDESVTDSIEITSDYIVESGKLEAEIVQNGIGNLMGMEDLNVYLSVMLAKEA